MVGILRNFIVRYNSDENKKIYDANGDDGKMDDDDGHRENDGD